MPRSDIVFPSGSQARLEGSDAGGGQATLLHLVARRLVGRASSGPERAGADELPLPQRELPVPFC